MQEEQKEIFIKDGIIFFIGNYNEDTMLVADSIGILTVLNVHHIELSCISKESLWKFMKYAHGAFVKDDKNAEYMASLFSEIHLIYRELYTKFETIARQNFAKFDDLLQYQKDDVFLGFYRKDNMLALEQGLGKTMEGIAIAETLKSKLTLIIMPAVSKPNWVKHLFNWGVNMTEITVLDTEKQRISPYEKYIVVNYDLLQRWEDWLKKKNITLIIADECHKAKNIDANRTRIIHDIQNICKSRLCLLSGTPASNKVDDLFSYLRLTKNPLGVSKTEFLAKFTKEIKFKHGGKKIIGDNLVMLNVALSNLIVRRRKKGTINIPDKEYHKLNFDIGSYKEEYDKAYEELLEALSKRKKGGIDLCLSQLNIISCKSKIKGIIAFAETLANKMQDVEVDDTYIDKDNNRVKTTKTIQVQSKVVIFCPFIEPLNMLQEYFKQRCVRIDGKIASSKRLAIAEKFLKSRSINFFIGQTDAAGIAIDLINTQKDKHLPSVHYVIHVGFPYTNAQLEQANDRVHRYGTYISPQIYYTVADGSIDEKILRLIQSKYNDVSVVIDGEKDIIDFNEVSFDELELLAMELEEELINEKQLTDFL